GAGAPLPGTDSEPVIGASTPPPRRVPPTDDSARIDYTSQPAPPPATPYTAPYADDEGGWDDGYASYDEYDEAAWSDAGYAAEHAPGRQPAVYMLIGLGVVLVAVLAFLLFSVMADGGGSQARASAEVVIDLPLAAERIPAGQEVEIS